MHVCDGFAAQEPRRTIIKVSRASGRPLASDPSARPPSQTARRAMQSASRARSYCVLGTGRYSCQTLNAFQPRQNPPASSAAPLTIVGASVRGVFCANRLGFRRIARRILRSSSASSGARCRIPISARSTISAEFTRPPLAAEELIRGCPPDHQCECDCNRRQLFGASLVIRCERRNIPQAHDQVSVPGIGICVPSIAHLWIEIGCRSQSSPSIQSAVTEITR